jgi:hypothetical protein
MAADAEDFEYALPPAASTIEALRGIGYSISTAVADLVDNSISASAKNVWIQFWWDGQNSQVTILDDGVGMCEARLSEAMRLGSRSPVAEREEHDLGRFGLGLKTASFSQCRRLTVATRAKDSELAVRRWDLDYVVACDEWRVLRGPAPGSEERLRDLNKLPSGTLVLWERLDQLVGHATPDDEHIRKHFLRTAEALREHLAMVFHRYLGGRQPELTMYLNGTEAEHQIAPWDPFLEDHPATSKTPIEMIPVGSGYISVQGFVLPHKDRLGENLHRHASGLAGWNAQQGFYVYRNRRLLVPGNWLGLGSDRPWTKEEHYKLARLRLDLPNSMDAQWQIDVKKSVARPPAIIRTRLRELADTVRRRARDVFSHRGQYQPRVVPEPLVRAWRQITRNGRVGYEINRDHPLVADSLTRAETPRELVIRLIKVIESTVPVQKIWLDMAEHSDSQSIPSDRLEEATVLNVMRELYQSLTTIQRLSHDAAVREILRSEPFNLFPQLAAHLVISD